MSILGSISQANTKTGLRLVIGAQEKMGKTTIGSMAPKSLLVPLEVGFAGVSTPKTKMLQTLDEILYFIQEVTYYASQGQFTYETIVFDSATALERQIHQSVIARDPLYRQGAGKKMITIETAHGGYGKGMSLANEEFDNILAMLDVLAITYGINIIFTAHVFPNKVVDPTAGEYDSWDLLLHSPKNMKNYGKRERITQWADIIGFMYEPMYVNKDDNLSRGISQNKGRVMGLSRTPSYVAGNRFGISGEVMIPAPPENGWNALANALYQARGIDVFNRQL